MSGPFGSSQWMYATGGVESQSLRFNDDDTASLERTPSTASNRKTWTFSAWVKRGNLGIYADLLTSDNGTVQTAIRFQNDDRFQVDYWNGSSYSFRVKTDAVYRDVSSWYHFVVKMDTTQSTAADRVKIYVNNESFCSYVKQFLCSTGIVRCCSWSTA